MSLIVRLTTKATASRFFLINKKRYHWNLPPKIIERAPGICQGRVERHFTSDRDDEDPEKVYQAVIQKRKESRKEEKEEDLGQHLGSGDMIQLNNFKKYLLLMSGRWKQFSDIPDALGESHYNSDLWVTRIRIASFMMILWVITAILTSLWGKRTRAERTHQVVLKQYYQSLSEAEKEEFLKEYNIDPKYLK